MTNGPKLLLAAATLFATGTAFAATQTWVDTDANNTWDTTATSNWLSGTAWSNATPDSAVFDGTGETVTLGTAITAGAITFNSTGYTIASNTLTLSGATPTIDVTTGATATFTSALSATGTVTKSGTGTLVLNAANTISALNVTQGTLQIIGDQVSNRLSNNATVTVASGATVTLNNTNPLPNQLNAVDANISGTWNYGTGSSHGHLRNVTLNGGTLSAVGGGTYDSEHYQLNGDVTVTGSAASTISASTGLRGTRTFTVADVTGSSAIDLTVSGAVNNSDLGTSNLVKAGAGSMLISGSLDLTGTTTVNAGTLRLTSSARNTTTITVNAGATLDTAGLNMFVGGHGVTVADARKIVVDGGTWLISGSESRIGNVDLKNGATWTSNRGVSSYDWLLANTTAGAATVTVSGTGASTMNGTGGIHLQDIQKFDVADTTGSSAADLNVTMILAGPGTSGGAAGGINKLGVGTMRLGAANTYTGGTIITAGTIVTGHNSALASGGVTLAGGTLQIGDGTVQTVTLSAGQNITATAAATLAFNGGSSAITLSGGGKYDFTGQTITLDLNNAFNAVNTYTLISGGTGNVDAAAYSFSNVDTGSFSYAFTNGVLTVTAIPEPSAYGLMGAGALAGVTLVRRRRKQAA